MASYPRFGLGVHAVLPGATTFGTTAVAMQFQKPSGGGSTAKRPVGRVVVHNLHASVSVRIRWGKTDPSDLAGIQHADVVIPAATYREFDTEIDGNFLIQTASGTFNYDPAGSKDIIIQGFERK